MKTHRALVVSTFACLLSAPSSPAQQGDDAGVLAASRQRLEKALAKTAALDDTGFHAEWGPTEKPDPNDPMSRMLSMSSGNASGSWHTAFHHCEFGGDEGDELVVAGGRTIAKSANHDWVLRSGRFADGNTISFRPDPAVLLQQLDDWQLAVIHREVGSIDDRPVEIITVTLNEDQIADAVWSGGLPPALVSGMSGAVFQFAAGAGAGGRRAATKPKAIVDVAIAIDPATSLVQRLQFRAYAAQGRGFPGGRVLIQRAGGAIQVAAAADEEEADEAEDTGPMQFENGLPKRSQTKKSVSDYTVRLSQHGMLTAPPLAAAQKKLLGL